MYYDFLTTRFLFSGKTVECSSLTTEGLDERGVVREVPYPNHYSANEIVRVRRGLASNLNRLGVDDSVIQRILRHSTVATTQNHYIKTASPDAIAAMRQFSTLLCSTCAPSGDIKCARPWPKQRMRKLYMWEHSRATTKFG